MTSAPASASDTACRARLARVASLSTSSPCEHAAVAVVGVLAEADVGDLRPGPAPRRSRARRARCTMPSGDQAALPSASLYSGRPKSRTARTPSANASRAVSTIWSTECWKTPGIEEMGFATPSPGTDEEREHQVVRREPGLPHQAAEGRGCGGNGGVGFQEMPWRLGLYRGEGGRQPPRKSKGRKDYQGHQGRRQGSHHLFLVL